MLTPHQFIIAPQEGKMVEVFGDRITVKVEGSETSEAWALFEIEVPAGQQSLPHYHSTFDEVYYVLEGQLLIKVGPVHQTITAGTLVQIPRQTLHQYQNPTTKTTRILTWVSPAGIETLITRLDQLSPEQRQDARHMLTLASQYDVLLDGG